ncbi:hypothetical protein GUJ93_ZPchr0006g41900 [Zizania palustris]|uniref:Neprosin PEP catalytic domain-containing protein n=1 Tax=Zizania palustris TaxID=103762 RepID=A0A8J5T6G0_ZIZPA|nr:hypothetical protein GUJ93_ZPchr0006g41900 [Zizania palustris]
MARSFCFVPLLVILTLLLLLLLLISSTSGAAATAALASMHSSGSDTSSNATAARLRPGKELRKYKRIRAMLQKLNTFSQDHSGSTGEAQELQPHRRWHWQQQPQWSRRGGGGGAGLACHRRGVPGRDRGHTRTTEKDLLRASSLRRYGRKPASRSIRRDSTSSGHEHAVGYVNNENYYGAKASVNVWSPRIGDPSEFSLSQIWVISGSFGDDLNTIEAGWQVSPELYGDSNQGSSRTGQLMRTRDRVLQPKLPWVCPNDEQDRDRRSYHARIGVQRKAVRHYYDAVEGPQAWALVAGAGAGAGRRLLAVLPVHPPGAPREHGAVRRRGRQQRAAVGLAHGDADGQRPFPGEGFDRAAYFRNLQVVDWDNSLIPAANLKLLADHPGCYDIQGGSNSYWGSYFYYGGPGKMSNALEIIFAFFTFLILFFVFLGYSLGLSSSRRSW